MTIRWRVLLVVAIFLIVKLVLASGVDIVEDEAYYAWWSNKLQWGYLDHPPLVAWLGALFSYPASAFKLRLVDIVLATIALLCFINLARRVLITPSLLSVEAATLLFSFSVAGLMFGVLHTPDVGVNACWVIVLHEAVIALISRPKRWLSAGFFTGVGLLSKYTMVLMLPVLFFGIFFGNRAQLKTRWPYLGLGLAFLVFLPHLVWNAQNDWLTMRFQLKRGFTQSHLKIEQQLPWSLIAATNDSPEYAVGQYFYDAATEPVEKAKRTGFAKIYRNVSSYFSAIVGMWGLLLLPILVILFVPKFRNREVKIHCELRALLFLSAVLPVLFFLAVAFLSKVEANWASFYIVGAALVLGPLVSLKLIKLLRGAAIANVMLAIGVLCLYLYAGDSKFGIARLERETNGYYELADIVSKVAAESTPAVLFDTYQTGAMLHQYAPQLRLVQYPGLARSSQFIFEDHSQLNSENNEVLVVVQHNRTPLTISGYDFLESTEVRSCAGRRISSWIYNRQIAYDNRCDGETLRRWFVSKYQVSKG